MKTALKMLTGLAWLVRGGRASRPPVVALRTPSREALLATEAYHRRVAERCASAGDKEGLALHEKHAGRYAAEARGNARSPACDPVFDRMHHVTWAEMCDGLHFQRLALEGRAAPIDKEELAQVLCNARRNTWQVQRPTFPNDQDHNVARAAIEFFRNAGAAAKSNTGGS
jgi:hypothetical protein